MNDNQAHALGEWLRQRREELGIGLEKAEMETRIRAQYLRALENEDYQALPNPVVGRGFLRNYAVYLGLDPHEAARRFPLPAAAPAASPSADKPIPVDRQLMIRPVPLYGLPSRSRRRGVVLTLILLPIVALASWAWWNYPLVTQMLSGLRPVQASPTQPVIAIQPTWTMAATEEVIVPTLAPTEPPDSASLMPEETQVPMRTPSATRLPTRSPTPSPPIYTGIFVELNVVAKSWLQVNVDGAREFQGELEAGSRRSWYGEQWVELRIGNAGGVEVTVNGQKLGILGQPGEVVERVFEIVDGELDLTATPEITSTQTVMLTTTPELSPTLPISPTATTSP